MKLTFITFTEHITSVTNRMYTSATTSNNSNIDLVHFDLHNKDAHLWIRVGKIGK